MLQSYLLMFVHSSPALQPDHDYEKIAERALNSYALGEHVAPHWDLGRVLKWRPMNVGNMSKPLGPDVDVPDPLLNAHGSQARSIGMYKVYGTTVEAVVGGVLHQFVRTVVCSTTSLYSPELYCYRVVPSRTDYSTLAFYRTFAFPAPSVGYMLDTTSMLWKFVSAWAALRHPYSDDRAQVLG